jgi:hypothetical protein
MSEQRQPNPAAAVLGELKRLRSYSEESMKRYLEIQRRIAELESKLEARADGTVSVKREE